MNKIYKLIWSKVKNMWVVASELAKSHTKSPNSGIVGVASLASLESKINMDLSKGFVAGVFPMVNRPVAKLSDFKITVAAIVKNEAENVPTWVQAARSCADEIVVVDTGSTDGTVEKFADYGIKCFHYDWNDDFASAKNYMISLCHGDWIVLLDGDEWFREGCDVRKAIAKHHANPMTKAIIADWICLDKDRNNAVMFSGGAVRAFRNQPDVRYFRRVHENLTIGIENFAFEPDFKMYHTGYSGSVNRSKHERNLRIMRTMFDFDNGKVEYPTDWRYIEDTYAGLGDFDKALWAADKMIGYGVQDYSASAWVTKFNVLFCMKADMEWMNMEFDYCFRTVPSVSGFRFLASIYYMRNGRPDIALEHFTEGVRMLMGPQDRVAQEHTYWRMYLPEATALVASYYLQHGQSDAALVSCSVCEQYCGKTNWVDPVFADVRRQLRMLGRKDSIGIGQKVLPLLESAKKGIAVVAMASGLVVGTVDIANPVFAACCNLNGDTTNKTTGYDSTVTGGCNNSANGMGSSVSGGCYNRAEGSTSSVSGGFNNTASCSNSSVSGGFFNTAFGEASSVSGGYSNVAKGIRSSVSGGNTNTASGCYSSVSGGYFNTASGCDSSVSGGWCNKAIGDCSSVSGGWCNKAIGGLSSVTGGCSNTANAFASSVSGGCSNTASGFASSVSGGCSNTASGSSSSVTGGQCNTASDIASSVSGGEYNEASGQFSSVSGGQCNKASGCNSSVSGGQCNTASGCNSSVSGGYTNKAIGGCSSVSGGCGNTASGWYSSVSGGVCNIASGDYSSVSGGQCNTASGYVSSVSGGQCNTASGYLSWVAGGCNGFAYANYSSVIGGGITGNVSCSETALGSVAIGNCATTTRDYEVAIGSSDAPVKIDGELTVDGAKTVTDGTTTKSWSDILNSEGKTYTGGNGIVISDTNEVSIKNVLMYDADANDVATLAGASGTKISNLKAGTLSKTSTDAVSGAQLYATNQNIAGFASDISKNKNNIANLNTSVTAALESVSASSTLVDTLNNTKADTSLNNLTVAGKQVIATAAANAVQEYMKANNGTVNTSLHTLNKNKSVDPASMSLMSVNPASADTNFVVYDDAQASQITLEGPLGTGTKITNVAVGELSAASTDAVNGAQLYKVTQRFDDFQSALSSNNTSIANAQTDNNKMKTANIQLESDVNTLKTQVETGFNVTIDGAKVKTVNPESNYVDFVAGDGLKIEDDNGSVKFSVDAAALGGVTQEQLDKKADLTYVDEQLGQKADKSYVDDGLAFKADKDAVYTKVEADDLFVGKAYMKDALEKKANRDASNIDTAAWAEKLGTGEIAADNTGLVNGGTVYEAISRINGSDMIAVDRESGSVRIAGNGRYDDFDVVDISKSDGSDRVLTGVATNPADKSSAANVGYVEAVGQNIANAVNDRFTRMDDRVNKVGANAAALSALTPASFEGDEKWSLAASVGNYRSATAGAVGAFYKPQENVMINVRGSFGNNENMIAGGVAVALNKGDVPGVTKRQLANAVNAQAVTIQNQANEIAELKEIVQQLVAERQSKK